MKQCTVCRTTYTDDSLRYCLADGGPLFDIGPEIETVVRPGSRSGSEGQASHTVPSTSANRGGMSATVKVLIALFLAGFLGLLVLGGAGVLYYMNSGSAIATITSTPTPLPTPSSTPILQASPSSADGTDDFDKELAELQKKLEEMVNAGKTTTDADDSDGTAIAVVNSPKDGFLALRAAPDAKTGERVAQIPHGAVVTIENCEKERVTIGGRSGRWCMVTYEYRTGWVFDAWLVY